MDSKRSCDSTDQEVMPFEIKENVFAAGTEEVMQSVVRERYKRAHGNTVRIAGGLNKPAKKEIPTRLSLDQIQRKGSNGSEEGTGIKSRLTIENEEETKAATPRGVADKTPAKNKKIEGFSGIM